MSDPKTIYNDLLRTLQESEPDPDPDVHFQDPDEPSQLIPITHTETSDSESCVVCAEAFKKDEELFLLSSCLHRFHAECLTPWFQTAHTCPICRKPVYLGEEYQGEDLNDSNRYQQHQNEHYSPFHLPEHYAPNPSRGFRSSAPSLSPGGLPLSRTMQNALSPPNLEPEYWNRLNPHSRAGHHLGVGNSNRANSNDAARAFHTAAHQMSYQQHVAAVQDTVEVEEVEEEVFQEEDAGVTVTILDDPEIPADPTPTAAKVVNVAWTKDSPDDESCNICSQKLSVGDDVSYVTTCSHK
ncbi:E3 ubiquitin-protein ligase rnf43 [Phlyctochytrium planicorne]|nr:E3 ubiquitin-protein ligase rnf43 [Phlyctochytrium planicorne]